jgi:hypothetical protein
MDCVCGCGKDVPGKLLRRNLIAAQVALELLAWDKNRASRSPGPDGREGLIARGADCYQRLLDSLHGDGADDPDADCDTWLGESSGLRAGDSSMTKWRVIGASGPRLSTSDMEQIDRKHPERSFTGALAADDLVDKLERLRVLRDDDVLTDEEFAAAKARLFGD